jgi:hypothetical protein
MSAVTRISAAFAEAARQRPKPPVASMVLMEFFMKRILL